MFDKINIGNDTVSKSNANSINTAQMKSISSPPLQLKCAACEEDAVQGKFAIQKMANPDEEEQIQGKFAIQKMAVPDEEQVQMKKSSPFQLKSSSSPIQMKSAMPEDVQMKMETAFDSDFSDVNIHTNSSQASEIGALAYTQGTDIHFAENQYDPSSQSGQELLGHELTHVVQQREGRVEPTTETHTGLPVNDDIGLESEADRMGAIAAQTKLEE